MESCCVIYSRYPIENYVPPERNDALLFLPPCGRHAERLIHFEWFGDQRHGAEYALEQIGMLYDIGRLAYPILVVFEKWIYNEIPKVLPGGRMEKALRYIYKDFHRLSRYHLDGLGCPVNELRMFRSALKEEVRLLRFFDKLTRRSSPDAYSEAMTEVTLLSLLIFFY